MSSSTVPYDDENTDYRRGFVEGQSGERDSYLLCAGCTNIEEYERGFFDGLASGVNCE